MPGQNVGLSTVTKADIIEKVYERIGFSKKEAADLVERVFETIQDDLRNGEKVKISGFGKFVVKGKSDRVGRNPRTGEEMIITARRVITFKVSQVLKAMLNGLDYKDIKEDLDDDDDDNDDNDFDGDDE